ncbi:MAG: biopolymer transporter TolR [Agriterribacter sp.]
MQLLKFFVLLIFCSADIICYGQQPLGIFEQSADVGEIIKKGSIQFDNINQSYTISGSGSNIWFKKDEFYYAWKKLRGDFILHAQASLKGNGVELHRKLGWMVRNSLDTNSAMITAAVHGDGLTALQYRKQKNNNVEESKSPDIAPNVIQLERKGNRFIMSTAKWGEPFTEVFTEDIDFGDEVYAGIYVCSHNTNVLESAVFENVRIIIPAKENFVPYRDYIGSHIETMDISSGLRYIIYSENASLQAPNWMHDNKHLIYNKRGAIYRLDMDTRAVEQIHTGGILQNNNDHVISFDGKMLGLSSSSGDKKYGSLVYTVPINGGIPQQITATGPSYLHGWSPDGKFLVYTGQRDNQFDIYKIPSTGGEEIRLTTAEGLDDGSEYSPDGKYIYFNSVRSGLMQLWRMKPDGTDQTQLTFDEYNNWFPHISPDGKWIAFLSFSKDILPQDHPFYKRVYLRLMPVSGGKPKVIAYVYGGQATINTSSWSPDSKKIAFVSNTGME